MFRTDYEKETIPFIIEGKHTQVFGIGNVVGKLLVAKSTSDILKSESFEEPGVIPLVLDEFATTQDVRGLNEVTKRLMSGLWAGFVTFGTSEMIRYRRQQNIGGSHFMNVLREFAGSEDFIAVVDNDESNKLANEMDAMILRSETSTYNGLKVVLTANSVSCATIEFYQGSTLDR